jgi:drug/metabolite transporter (DMT)-like permease
LVADSDVSDGVRPAAVERARYRLGLLLITASMVAWSTAGFFTRLIMLDGWTMLFWRGVFGAFGMTLFMIAHDSGRMLRGFADMGSAGWLFAFVSGFGMVSYIMSLTLTSVAHVAIIYGTVPFLAAGLGWLLMRERATAGAIVASLVGAGGLVGGADRVCCGAGKIS